MNPWTLLLWVLVIAALAAGLQWARQMRAGGDDREKGL